MHKWRGWKQSILAQDFGISQTYVNLVVMMWATLERHRYAAFGIYPTIFEDLYMQPMWDPLHKQFPGAFIVKWDTTNVPLLGKPSHGIMQKLTNNTYYGMCCFKAGVATTTWGFNIAQPVWSGEILDSVYICIW